MVLEMRKQDEAACKRKLNKVLSEQRRVPDGKNPRFWNMKVTTESGDNYRAGFSKISWGNKVNTNLIPNEVRYES